MQVQSALLSQELPSPQDSLPFGFQKLPVGASVLHYDINDFFYYIFFSSWFFYIIYLKGSIFCTVNLQ